VTLLRLSPTTNRPCC